MAGQSGPGCVGLVEVAMTSVSWVAEGLQQPVSFSHRCVREAAPYPAPRNQNLKGQTVLA